MEKIMKKKSISTRLSTNYALLIVIMISVLAFTFYKYNQHNIYEEGLNNLRQISETTSRQIDSKLTSMEQVTVEVLSDNDFLKAWYSYQSLPLKENEKIINRILNDSYVNRNDIRRVTVFSKDGIYCSTGHIDVTKEQVKKRAEYIERCYQLNTMNSRIFLKSDLDFWNKGSGDFVVSEIKPIKDSNSTIIGYIEVQQNLLYLERICNIEWNNTPIKVLILTGYDYDFFYSNNNLEKEYIQKITLETKPYTKVREDDEKILYTVSSNYYIVRTVFILEKGILYSFMHSILSGISIIAILVLILTINYIIIVTKRVMKPINLLTKWMETTELHNISEKKHIIIKNRETEILVNSYENMRKRLQDALIKQKKVEDAQIKTLFGILQSEIGPHFLYNTLGSIANMCEQGETESAADACYSLTEILRYSSNYTDYEVTIMEEIDNLKSYLAIMKSRYRQRLSYEIVLDDEAKIIPIPKLTYQPLVENAIRYSLIEKELVKIKIYTVLFDNYLMVEIKDNGCGITDDKIMTIQKKVDKLKSSKIEGGFANNVQLEGKGLCGTLMRLSIYYGDKFAYIIKNNNDEGGTSIILKINNKVN